MIKKIIRFLKTLIFKSKNRKKVNNSFEDRVSLHFLFNSLNSVITLCRKNPEGAAELVGEISTYLQRSLEDKKPFIELEEELEHVMSYVNIQKARFFDRLKIVLDMEDNIQCLIPPFTLQPIVDNAIRHGVLKRKQGGIVCISIKKLSRGVRITVKDDGTGMTGGQLDLLLKRSSRRHSVYKVNHALKAAGSKGVEIQSALNEGTLVTIEIPFL